MLQLVTFTGTDDNTDPMDLIRFSNGFPFVEWGILIGSRQGGPRMPTRSWIEAFLQSRITATHKVNISLHICSRPLKDIANGKATLFEEFGDLSDFDRVQLNWHGERQREIGFNIATVFSSMRIQCGWEPEIIFQGDETNVGAGLHLEAERMGFPVSMLFDTSPGAGELPQAWPDSIPTIKCGYAGGLGPDNVTEEYVKICAAHIAGGSKHSFWIDMESKVRSEPNFDLAKCWTVAELMKPEIWQEEAP